MATPVTAEECAAALESMLGDLYGGAEVEARIAADLLRRQDTELTTLRTALDSLRPLVEAYLAAPPETAPEHTSRRHAATRIVNACLALFPKE